MRTIPGWVKPSRRHGSITSSGYLRALDGKGVAVAAPNREWYRRLEMAEVLAFVTDRRREDLTLDFKVGAGNFAHFSAEPVAGSRTPGTRGRSKEALGSITIGMSLNRQVLLARSVATMLPRPGSTRGTPGDWRGRPHGWNVMTDKDLAPEVLPVDLPEVWVETRRSTPAGIRALLSTCNPVRLTP